MPNKPICAHPIASSDTVDDDRRHLLHRNNRAWDTLYGATAHLVWGRSPAPFLSEYLPRLQDALTKESRILDIATGEGRNLDLLLKTDAMVYACDFSQNGLAKIPIGSAKKVRRMRCDITTLPIANETFAAAFLIDVIETIPLVEDVIREAGRILVPNGVLLCNIPGPDDDIACKDMFSLDDDAFLYKERYYYRFYTEDEACRLLEENGFSVDDVSLFTWWEAPHPEFREARHQHTSRVFLLRKKKSVKADLHERLCQSVVQDTRRRGEEGASIHRPRRDGPGRSRTRNKLR